MILMWTLYKNIVQLFITILSLYRTEIIYNNERRITFIQLGHTISTLLCNYYLIKRKSIYIYIYMENVY